MKILITGTAGFIGFHLVHHLASKNVELIGLDIINDYYDVNLKYNRLANTGIEKSAIQPNTFVQSSVYSNYRFIQADLKDKSTIDHLFETEQFDVVVNLAAQAGVPYSLKNPYAYIDSNILGFLNIMEAARAHQPKHVIYASSSSVYGMNSDMPLSAKQTVDHPLSFYAVSKKTNELTAHNYSHLYGVPTTGLRFFTAYGPWGRPDMSLYIFAERILTGVPIQIFNHGDMLRDFTFVRDITTAIEQMLDQPPKGRDVGEAFFSDASTAPFRLYNIGNNNPVKLMDYIKAIESAVGKEAIKEMKPMNPYEVKDTYADVQDLVNDFNYKPETDIKDGIAECIAWYLKYREGVLA